MKNSLSSMMCLDIYLSSLTESEYGTVSDKLNNECNLVLPLMSWDIFSQANYNALLQANRRQDLNQIKSLAIKLNWNHNYNSFFEEEQFEAIIVTDIDQEIVWVNNGFSKMTGYSKIEALNKKPYFLQGEKTLNKTKKKIRKQLNSGSPFKEVITNYKKNGESYECEVKIYPLYNSEKVKTHYIAFEKQVV